MYRLINVICFMCLVGASAAYGLTVDKPLPVPNQEARATALFSEIRCVACQSESLADSRSQIAADMRHVIRDQVSAGKTNEEIKTYLVSRYGDHILMRPPFKPATWLLWTGPIIIFLAALFMVRRYFQKARSDVL
ncbi:MAG: cytochrome c-type biogenesis protein [Rickettsiales bacterium]